MQIPTMLVTYVTILSPSVLMQASTTYATTVAAPLAHIPREREATAADTAARFSPSARTRTATTFVTFVALYMKTFPTFST